jgi:hypothetical protein
MALRWWNLLLGITGFCVACSSKTVGGSQIGGSDLSKGGGGAAGADNAGAGALMFGTGTGGTTLGAGATATGTGGVTNVCGSRAFKAEPAPVDMYIMFDKSVSMADPIPNSSPQMSWWQAAQAAVTSFVGDPRAGGSMQGSPAMTVGIQYFPLGGIAPQSCMAAYDTPAVELGLLPGNSMALAASIQSNQPGGFTPTSAAITGAFAHMKQWAPQHVGHAPVVVLVTDGFPTECDPLDPTDIATIAKTAFETDPPVRTFVVGFNLGLAGQNLDAIATAGGTNKAFLIDKGDIGSQFVDAILSISTTQLQFDLPKPPDGQELDITQVAVTYTPSATGVEAQVPKLNGLGDCDLNNGQGWFDDAPTSPTKIEVCPGTCSKFAAGTVKTASGCEPLPGLTR